LRHRRAVFNEDQTGKGSDGVLPHQRRIIIGIYPCQEDAPREEFRQPLDHPIELLTGRTTVAVEYQYHRQTGAQHAVDALTLA
jgi:hypothetical protein